MIRHYIGGKGYQWFPELREVRRGREIGRTNDPRHNYIWVACEICGKEKWRRLDGNKSRSSKCCGWRHTEEAKLKMSLGKEGDNHPMSGRQHTIETKSILSLAKRGNKNPNWKGGLKELAKGIRCSPEYYQWRKSVLERDKHICQDCYAPKCNVAHHIQSVIDYPDGIFEIDNGLTLCGDCHRWIHYGRG